MNPPPDLAAMRHEYTARGLRRAELDPDPIRQFAAWLEAAVATGIREANAMSLATVTADAKPAVRIVLLKGFDERGFVFYTNYASAKGQQLAAHPQAALAFFWPQFERQIRIEGAVETTTRAESEHYFHARPVGSQLGAFISAQSAVIPSRASLETQLAEAAAQFEGEEVPLPENWGGFRVRPATIEFWQGRANRLHDRLRYRRAADGAWLIERLAP